MGSDRPNKLGNEIEDLIRIQPIEGAGLILDVPVERRIGEVY